MNNDDLLDPSVKSNNNGGGFNQLPLPNSTAVLVLGIISIAGCIFYGIPGLVCGIIAIVLHKKDKIMYESNPSAYELSYKNSRAGFVCGIIGLSLSIFFLLLVIFSVFISVAGLSMIR